MQPARVPGFAFAYLELIAHRAFLPRLLLASGQKGWPLFQRLLSVMLKFMEPYLRSAKLSEPVRAIYTDARIYSRRQPIREPPTIFDDEHLEYTVDRILESASNPEVAQDQH